MPPSYPSEFIESAFFFFCYVLKVLKWFIEAKCKVIPLEIKNMEQMGQIIVLQSNYLEKILDILLDKQLIFIS